MLVLEKHSEVTLFVDGHSVEGPLLSHFPCSSVSGCACNFSVPDHAIIESQNHRMVWVGRDLIGHLVPTLCHGQGRLPLHQIAQGPTQPGLEHLQAGGILALDFSCKIFSF